MINPATDEEIAKLPKALQCTDCGCRNPEACDVFTRRLIARIEADRIKSDEKDAEIALLKLALAQESDDTVAHLKEIARLTDKLELVMNCCSVCEGDGRCGCQNGCFDKCPRCGGTGRAR